MPEPISTVLGIAALGAAAGKVVEKGWDAGSRWITDYLGGHGEEVQRRAQNNTIEFLCDLANRIDKIEQSFPSDGTPVDDAQERLRDPDFAATLQTALIAAARSSDPEKHALLAELVANRFAAEPESILSLATTLATETVGRLLPKHCEVLAIRTVVQVFSPRTNPKLDPENEAQIRQELHDLSVALRQFDYELDISHWDLAHLEAVGCISRLQVTTYDLSNVLAPSFLRPPNWAMLFKEFVEDDVVGRSLNTRWLNVWGTLQLAPVGLAIGRAVVSNRMMAGDDPQSTASIEKRGGWVPEV